MVDIKTIEFILENDEAHIDFKNNEIYYIFTSPDYVEKTIMTVRFVEGQRAIKSVEFLYPKIVGYPGIIQYPINMTEERILRDYDEMVKRRNEWEFRWFT